MTIECPRCRIWRSDSAYDMAGDICVFCRDADEEALEVEYLGKVKTEESLSGDILDAARRIMREHDELLKRLADE